MRLSDLLAVPVADSDGEIVGGVADVILVQDGPLLPSGHSASLRVAGLIVVERNHSNLLGYERDMKPAAFRWLARRLAGKVFSVPWEDVAEVTPVRVTLRHRRALLAQHDPAARRSPRT